MQTMSFKITNLQLGEARPDLSGNPFLLVLQVLFNLKSSAKKIGSGRRK